MTTSTADSARLRGDDSRRRRERTRTIERELDLIRGAVAMVANGTVRRVTIVGLQHADAILPEAEGLAVQSGLRAAKLGRSIEIATLE